MVLKGIKLEKVKQIIQADPNDFAFPCVSCQESQYLNW